MVTLPRRLAALIVALVATASLAPMALGSARDVINDFTDNGVIDSCHPRADYGAARDEPIDPSYGDLPGAIDVALANPALVGTAETPCPEVAESESGSNTGGIVLAVAGVGLGLLAGGTILATRRRRMDGDGDGPGGAA